MGPGGLYNGGMGMDYGKYIDIAVQNPRGKEILRLIQQPENFSKLVDTVGTFGLRPIRTPQGKIEVVRDEEEEEKYALKVFCAAVWSFGVNRITLRNEHYWRVHPLRTTRSPWGCIPMEIYILDMFLENVIKPQCPW